MTTPEPAQVEAEGIETLTISWADLTITLPASSEDWDFEAMEAYEAGKLARAVGLLLGDEGFTGLKREFTKKHGRKLLVRDFGELVEVIGRAYGWEPGE